MGFWFFFIFWMATFALSQLLTPKPEIEHAKAASLNDFNFPTATEGRIVPLGWGRDKISGPNVTWYGNLRVVPITKKVKTGMFSSKRVTVGYKYFVGFDVGICIGPATLHRIWIGDELAWEGTQSSDGPITIKTKDFDGVFYFYTGSTTQGVDSYLAQFQNPCPAYRRVCHGVWRGGLVGETTNVKPWAFEVSRCPTGLGSATPVVNGADANLMEVAYEILTDAKWGYGYPAADINVNEFRTVAATLATEGNGFSYYLKNQRKATEILTELEKQMDGKFRIDAATGQWRVSLARDGYDPGLLRVANSANILEVVDFSRGAWEGTINHVRIQYSKRANQYGVSYAPAQDGANLRIQGRVVPATYTFVGVKEDALANKLAWRELRSNSYPFSKGRFKVNRSFWDCYVGEVLLLNYTIGSLAITNLPMRITKIDTGNAEEPEIIIDCVQDVFSWRAASFADPSQTQWVAPLKNLIPFAAADQLAFEAPYGISRRAEYPSEGRIFCTGASQNRGEAGFHIRQQTVGGGFFDAGDCDGLAFKGELAAELLASTTASIDVVTGLGASELLKATDGDIGLDLANLIWVDGEFMACREASTISGGVQLSTLRRGLLGTAPKTHAAGTTVWFISTGGQLADTVFPNTGAINIKLMPYDLIGNQVSESDAGLTQIDITMNRLERRPYAPSFLTVNGTTWGATASLDVSQGATEDDKGLVIGLNRRDYRIYDEVSQLTVDASTINADFPANNTTEYCLEVYDATPALLYTTGWSNNVYHYVFRTTVLRYLAGAVPASLTVKVRTRHTYSGVVLESVQTVDWSFATTSAELTGDFNLGVLGNLEVSNSWTAPTTGSYVMTLGTVNSGGPIEARINGGSWATVITTGNLSGSLGGVTAGDTIEVRANGFTCARSETILKVDAPSSTEDAYAVFHS